MATRKLKLQVQMSVDGFVAGPEGQLDWMTEHDDGVIARIVQITDSSDTILLRRKMTHGLNKYCVSTILRPKRYSGLSGGTDPQSFIKPSVIFLPSRVCAAATGCLT